MKLRLSRSGAVALFFVAVLGGLGAFEMARRSPPGPPASPQPRRPVSAEGRIYDAKCGICHLANGPGTLAISRRNGEANAVLAERTDLDASLIKAAARMGMGGMPPQTRVDVTETELDRIVAYLTRPAAERSPPLQPAPGWLRHE